jgi:hypothetical protein
MIMVIKNILQYVGSVQENRKTKDCRFLFANIALNFDIQSCSNFGNDAMMAST